VTEAPGYLCACCGQHHADVPLSYATMAPDAWRAELAHDDESRLSSDLCVIRGEHFFVRGLIEIPVIGGDEPFSWGVWVSLSRERFAQTVRTWETPGRESQSPAFGWLNTTLPIYTPTTINLKTNVHTRPLGERPAIELEPTDHPLAVEQRTGITHERVLQIAEQLTHHDWQP
jgi:hypothetical protein